MKIRCTALLLLCGFVAAARPAQAQDLFGRTEARYDLSGSPAIRNRLDYAYIHGQKPTYAEQKGLAGLPAVEVRRNYVYIQDTDGSLTIPWQRQQDLFESFNFALNELYQAVPDDFIFVYLFTAFETGVGAFFYSPESNSTRGIGSDLFDGNGLDPREGFVFMNYWKSFEQVFQGAPQEVIRAQARSVFNQEAGHRWASFTNAGPNGNGAGPDVMLGRDDSHWSFFLQTGGSPMEGNNWRDNQNGTFTTITGTNNWHYSDLDLYLMGLIAPGDVMPWFVITNPNVNGQTDLFGQTITKSSPPQIIQPATISGTRVDLTIADIQTLHGDRNPAAGVAPTRWRVAFVMLAGQTGGLSNAQKIEFEGLVDDYATGFKQGTRNLGELDYALMADPKSPIGGPCASIDDCDQLEANVCLPSVGSPPVGLCTRPCTSAGSCPADYCCQEFTGSPSTICLPTAMCQPECTCDVTLGACDQGCDCDPECVNPCPCDTGDGCQDNCSCDPMCPVGCDCDTSDACDGDGNGGNCACDPQCAAGCACDVTFSCDVSADGTGNCACDPECVPCACDLTFACDDNCSCDPECKTAGGGRDHGGCGCTAIETHGATWLSLLLVSLLGIAFTRRRS